MKMLKFLIVTTSSHVYILLLLSVLITVQLVVNCEHSSHSAPDSPSHKKNHITLTAENGSTTYTYNPSPPQALRLGKGSFGYAVIGERMENGVSTRVAMKIEKIAKPKIPMLHNEQRMYKILNGQAGVPHFFDYFNNHHGKAILVIELLGRTLNSLFQSRKKFTVKTVMMIGLQILDIIEGIHKKGILYSDIKPDNFAIGRENGSKIHILDFGLSTFYMKDGNHVHPGAGKGAGTAKYLSLYAHSHFVQSRRDDIESIAYMLIEFLNGQLWGTDIIDEIIQKKTTYGIKRIARRKCSKTMVEFLKYARQLKYTEKPDYDHLRGILKAELIKNLLINDGQFDWITDPHQTEIVQSPISQMSSVLERSMASQSLSNGLPQTHHSSIARDRQIETPNKMPAMNVLIATATNSIPNINKNVVSALAVTQPHVQQHVLLGQPISNINKNVVRPLAVTQPHVQHVLLGQPTMSLTQPITNSVPIISNGLPTNCAIQTHAGQQPQPQQYLTPVLI